MYSHYNSSMSSWTSQPPPPIPEGVIPASMPRASNKSRGPSGLAYTWRLWRHCCCRFGWYPLLIAPVATAACVFSLYSSFGCDFVRLDIGFEPGNNGWNQSTAQFGLLSYYGGKQFVAQENSYYMETLFEGCQWYDDDFSESFIQDDRTWKAAKIMAYISSVASLLGMLVSWLFVCSPLPAFLFWPGVLMPSLVASFLAEGSKFLVFDAGICRKAMWVTTEENPSTRVAEECSLGISSYLSIGASGLFFVSLLFVCLHAPEKRELDADFGTRTDVDQGESDLDSPRGFGEDDAFNRPPKFDLSRIESGLDDSYEMPPSHFSKRVVHAPEIEYRASAEDPVDYSESVHGQLSTEYQHDELVSERLRSLDGDNDRFEAQMIDTSDCSSGESIYNPQKSSKMSTEDEGSVSRSRLHAAERLALNSTTASVDLIDKFVSEVTDAFVASPETEQSADCTADAPQSSPSET